jgi:hypothetical protein
VQRPCLGHLPVSDVEDLDGLDLQAPAGPLGPGGVQRDHVFVIAYHVVQFDSVRAAGQLSKPTEYRGHPVHALMVTG